MRPSTLTFGSESAVTEATLDLRSLCYAGRLVNRVAAATRAMKSLLKVHSDCSLPGKEGRLPGIDESGCAREDLLHYAR